MVRCKGNYGGGFIAELGVEGGKGRREITTTPPTYPSIAPSKFPTAPNKTPLVHL